MLKSMTGYGKAVIPAPGRHITLELKTLNSKGLDITVKAPPLFREKEPAIRIMLSALERGKIDLFIFTDISGEEMLHSINKPLARHYFEHLKELQKELREDCPYGLLPLILRMPDIFQSDREGIDEALWMHTMAGIESVIQQVNDFRLQEGNILEADILARIQSVQHLIPTIAPFEPERKARIRSALLKELEDLSLSTHGTFRADPNRLEQELIFYLEKMDFTEEYIRLNKHIEYFLETLQKSGAQGKKLGFILQEISREINTLGVKASHAEIQKIVVQVKDETEKIREQLLNIL